ncbi:hypothetical protein N8H74_21895 [Pseudomonas sp. B2M1-30]|uniref:hypothetical protein n=1 Tax=Pseudomonas TaxID=286 RepID=UPI0021C5F07D|nr:MULTISPECIES: hypothetical protein [Pseudomonas]MCU0120923.1 hypothetical protein [Pseudomonas sp. B2M1-30]MCU7259888.1 hypothetical protein [Pseudomonas koreensis]
MSTYDAKARRAKIEREIEEYAEEVRIKDKDEARKMWLLFGFGLYCMLLGVLLGRSF